SWTDNVLIGSNRLFIVTESTVPGLRYAQNLVTAIIERLGDDVQPRGIVNRFEQRLFGPGLRRAHLNAAPGGAPAGTTPHNHALVREAIDRGVPLEEVKPRNPVTTELKKLIDPHTAAQRKPAAPAERGRSPVTAR